MNILDKVGEGLATTVDLLVEKNRQMAQLNRLSAIIKTEKDMINRAYIALGKQYFSMLQGNAEENDMSQICEVIKFSEERLKKAQARYDYVKVYGVPASQVDTVDMIRSNDQEEAEPSEEAAIEIEDEGSDITIAVAGEDAAEETKSEEAEEKSADESEEHEEAAADEEKTEETAEADDKTVAEKAAETISQFKKRRSRKVENDSEAENDN